MQSEVKMTRVQQSSVEESQGSRSVVLGAQTVRGKEAISNLDEARYWRMLYLAPAWRIMRRSQSPSLHLDR